jgi:hypothetical protein
MVRQVVLLAMGGALVWSAAAVPLPAESFTVIPEPSFYPAGTTLINIRGLVTGHDYTSISGDGLTVTFSTAMVKLQVPTTWGTWNCPPHTVTCTPAVLWSNGASEITMTLSRPVSVFGFEAQPDLSDVEPMTAMFFGAGDNLLGEVPLDVSGDAGALVFAASSSTPIDSVTFTDAANKDFAIADVEFLRTPEPLPVLLLGTGLAALGLRELRRVKRA